MTSLDTDPSLDTPPPVQRIDARLLVTAGVVVLGSIMSILDITVVNVGIPTFMDAFGKTQAQVAWVATGYTLALATVIPLTGWAADRFGTKRLYMTAIFLFAVGSTLCSTANSLELLITYRVLQGLGGGMLMPLGMTILTRAAGQDRVGRVMAILGIPMLMGPIAGPILGGWLIDVASWHWMFLINVPIGVVALIYAYFALKKDDVVPSESFDFVGMLLLSPGLALFLYGVSSLPASQTKHGTYFSAEVLAPAIIGIVLIAAFIPWALRKKLKHPLIDLRLFRDRNMTVAVICIVVFCAAFFGAGLLFPSYFQQVRGASPMKAGLLLAPQGIGSMVMMPIAGVLADRIGTMKVVLPGIVLIVIGMVGFGTLSDTTAYWFLLLELFIMGLGMGATMMPLFSGAMATLQEHSIARGSTLVNIVQQIAASIGTALFSVLLTSGIKHRTTGTVATLHEMGGAYASSFIVATIAAAVVIIPALFLPRIPTAQAERQAHAPMH